MIESGLHAKQEVSHRHLWQDCWGWLLNLLLRLHHFCLLSFSPKHSLTWQSREHHLCTAVIHTSQMEKRVSKLLFKLTIWFGHDMGRTTCVMDCGLFHLVNMFSPGTKHRDSKCSSWDLKNMSMSSSRRQRPRVCSTARLERVL